MEKQPRGSYRIIRVDGSETVIGECPSIPKICGLIGCDTIDTVVLVTHAGRAHTVMMVDDTGMIDGKPVNAKATALRNQNRGLSPYQIHGDVVIVNDADFS